MVRSEKFEAKRSKKKRKNYGFRLSVQNACETDLVSLRFALEQKNIFCETGVLGTLFDPCRLAYLAYTSND
jgi:hypothetical protein